MNARFTAAFRYICECKSLRQLAKAETLVNTRQAEGLFTAAQAAELRKAAGIKRLEMLKSAKPPAKILLDHSGQKVLMLDVT